MWQSSQPWRQRINKRARVILAAWGRSLHGETWIWRTLVLLLGLSLFATVQAQAQNGLQRFESDIKPQLEFKSFTYGKAAPLGAKGFR